MNPISPQSSLQSIDHSSINDGMSMQHIQSREDFQIQAKERPYNRIWYLKRKLSGRWGVGISLDFGRTLGHIMLYH